ncbi:hypothetical protein AGLY_000395 [Aphis glycines]|uniref:Uncharacterized protein n=1 Tax=Aphis glycines TaxID=307491 RepID=A0A6G0U7C8_APHGL|nr:hypothetical protein AGLY_000395 [Aphis glycines]
MIIDYLTQYQIRLKIVIKNKQILDEGVDFIAVSSTGILDDVEIRLSVSTIVAPGLRFNHSVVDIDTNPELKFEFSDPTTIVKVSCKFDTWSDKRTRCFSCPCKNLTSIANPPFLNVSVWRNFDMDLKKIFIFRLHVSRDIIWVYRNPRFMCAINTPGRNKDKAFMPSINSVPSTSSLCLKESSNRRHSLIKSYTSSWSMHYPVIRHNGSSIIFYHFLLIFRIFPNIIVCVISFIFSRLFKPNIHLMYQTHVVHLDNWLCRSHQILKVIRKMALSKLLSLLDLRCNLIFRKKTIVAFNKFQIKIIKINDSSIPLKSPDPSPFESLNDNGNIS